MFAGWVAASYVDTLHPFLTSRVADTAALRTPPPPDPARVYLTHVSAAASDRGPRGTPISGHYVMCTT